MCVPHMDVHSVDVTLLHFSGTSACQQNLGMGDGYIEDFQITSSLSSPGHPASAARPGGKGWCTPLTNDFSYLQVS